MLRIVIVEDEPHAVRRLRMAIGPLRGVRIVGVATDGREALDLIEQTSPDILFLDINLPGPDGMQVAAAAAGRSTIAVIFVTAYKEHAVEAFRAEAVDYLLKPVQFDQVAAAVERARARLQAKEIETRAAAMERLLRRMGYEASAEAGAPDYETELWVPGRHGAVRVSLSEVEVFEAERDYVRIHSEQGQHLLRGVMQSLNDRIDPEVFLRVHRSAIVNMRRVARTHRREGGGLELVMKSGRRVPVGRTYSAAIRSATRSAGRRDEGLAT
jgi:two-component system LytT family response regulator/two-component system response regulator AlgR